MSGLSEQDVTVGFMANSVWWSEGPEWTSLGTLLSTGAGVMWCDADCREQWLGVALPREIWEDPVAIEVDSFACTHCHWCGRLITAPDDCLLHGTECPERNFFATATALEVVHLESPPGLVTYVPWSILELAAKAWRIVPHASPARLRAIAITAWRTARRFQEERDELE